MSNSENTFSFIDRYKGFQPVADRSIVEARRASHKRLRTETGKSAEKIVSIVCLSFGILEHQDNSQSWIEGIVKEKDPHFSLSRDVNEARIIATLVLEDLIASGYKITPAMVLVGSFCGRRRTVDNGEIVAAARASLASQGRSRGLRYENRIAAPAWRDVSKTLSAAKAGDAASLHAAIEAVAGEAKEAEKRLTAKFNEALTDLTVENRRLAEEVDLLWWHIGRWSYLLDRPLSEIDDHALPFLVGVDIATMINVLPGPHGALGIIRDALGPEADAEQSIAETLTALGDQDRAILLKGISKPIGVVSSLHFGLGLLDEESLASAVPAVFQKRTSLSMEAKLSRFEIAVQAFYERMFMKLDWL
ncbi:hypothetical protein GTW51_17990 [Aurantimonas aggregata]|uniref:GTPase-associated system helical domain-containing protein n=1 Tax=Aurantimonas aggregata TaxID=2047720 RepID=A0A6L9MLS6_9HYPH|nr:GTPase-associated system all-helical protein GASH [Aurantimonas aggregata]NDV88596.1 hypothetical protein [Aurantimonas aggregata]